MIVMAFRHSFLVVVFLSIYVRFGHQQLPQGQPVSGAGTPALPGPRAIDKVVQLPDGETIKCNYDPKTNCYHIHTVGETPSPNKSYVNILGCSSGGMNGSDATNEVEMNRNSVGKHKRDLTKLEDILSGWPFQFLQGLEETTEKTMQYYIEKCRFNQP